MNENNGNSDKADKLRGMVSLGIPETPMHPSRTKREPNAEATKTDTDIFIEEQPSNEPEKTASIRKKRKIQGQSQEGNYKDTYFARIDFSDRQPLYITRSTHETLMRIVSIVGGRKATISSYVENIILRHLESYREEINRLYDDHYSPPVKE